MKRVFAGLLLGCFLSYGCFAASTSWTEVDGYPFLEVYDGGAYVLDYALPMEAGCRVDYGTGHQTDATELIVSGDGYCSYIEAWNSSKVTMGGIGIEMLLGMDSSHLTIQNGSLQYLFSHDDSYVEFSGGTVAEGAQILGNSRIDISGGHIRAFVFTQYQSTGNLTGGIVDSLTIADYSTMQISGGIIEQGIQAGSLWDKGFGHHSIIEFFGSGFAINGVPVEIGHSAREYASYEFYQGTMAYTGIVTGRLANGDTLNNRFFIIDEADIVFVPEPATCLLVGLGGIGLLKKRRA